MNRELRPHQVEAMDGLRASLASGKRRPMLQAPTGFGKTMLAAGIVDRALAKGKRVLFTVPALSLVDQTVQAFWAEGIRDVGVIQSGHVMTDWSRPVQVASVQTLMRRVIPDADIAIVDEAHRLFSFYGKWFAMPEWVAKPIIGLSATPWTRGLGKLFDDLIVAATTRELIDARFLSDFKVFAPSHPDLSGVRTVAGDYHEGDLSTAMDKPTLVADVVETWLRRGEDRPTFVFAVDRAHAKHLEQQFDQAGVSAGYIDAHTDRAERESIRRRFHAGDIRVVCNVGCLTTGVDWDVRCIVLARPTKSEILFVQMLGRGLRTALGKDHCLILDHSDTHLRLGMVDQVHHERLDDGKGRPEGKRKPKAVLPKACEKCSYVKLPKMHVCPSCGFKPERVSSVEQEDGELAELNGHSVKADMATKQRWFSMLVHYGNQHGYKAGWAANKYREKFKAWPRALSDLPMQPDAEIMGFIRHSQIRWAKSRRAA